MVCFACNSDENKRTEAALQAMKQLQENRTRKHREAKEKQQTIKQLAAQIRVNNRKFVKPKSAEEPVEAPARRRGMSIQV